MAALRSETAREFSLLESSRLNAIRQIDVLAVNTAADRAQTATQALAAVATTNADNLRNALAATASTIAAQLAETIKGVTERISALEKSSYEGAGRERYADPQMVELVSQVRALSDSRAAVSGKSAGLSSAWLILIGGVGLLSTLFGIACGAVTLYFLLSRR